MNYYIDYNKVLHISDTDTIGAGAFRGRTDFSSVVIPDEVKVIGDRAFYGCDNIEVTIHKDLTYIGDYAFSQCANLKFHHQSDEDDNSALYHIGRGVFDSSSVSGNLNLTSVQTTSIPDCAFRKCTGSFSVYTKHQIQSVGDYAFYESNISHNVLSDKIVKIGNFAFYQCTDVSGSLRIDNSVSIGDYAFYNTALEQVVLPNVYHLGERTFQKCELLGKAIIGTRLNKIGDYLFEGCKTLVNFNVPSSVSEIGGMAFANMGGGNAVTINYGACTMIPTFGANVYNGTDRSDSMLVVPDNLYSSWPSKTQYMQKKKLSASDYIRFVIDKYTFLGDNGMTWAQWAASDYAKTYCLPDADRTIWSYSRYITLDNRHIDGKELSNTINWPCKDGVKSVGSRSGLIAITPNTTITPNGTYSIAKGMSRSPYWDTERNDWYYYDN